MECVRLQAPVVLLAPTSTGKFAKAYGSYQYGGVAFENVTVVLQVSNPHLILIIITPKSSPNPHLTLTSSSSSQAEATAYEKQRHHRAWLEIDSAHGLIDLTLNATVIALPGSGGKSFALNDGFWQVHFY